MSDRRDPVGPVCGHGLGRCFMRSRSQTSRTARSIPWPACSWRPDCGSSWSRPWSWPSGCIARAWQCLRTEVHVARADLAGERPLWAFDQRAGGLTGPGSQDGCLQAASEPGGSSLRGVGRTWPPPRQAGPPARSARGAGSWSGRRGLEDRRAPDDRGLTVGHQPCEAGRLGHLEEGGQVGLGGNTVLRDPTWWTKPPQSVGWVFTDGSSSASSMRAAELRCLSDRRASISASCRNPVTGRVCIVAAPALGLGLGGSTRIRPGPRAGKRQAAIPAAVPVQASERAQGHAGAGTAGAGWRSSFRHGCPPLVARARCQVGQSRALALMRPGAWVRALRTPRIKAVHILRS